MDKNTQVNISTYIIVSTATLRWPGDSLPERCPADR